MMEEAKVAAKRLVVLQFNIVHSVAEVINPKKEMKI
jgi:hypothetical protein